MNKKIHSKLLNPNSKIFPVRHANAGRIKETIIQMSQKKSKFTTTKKQCMNEDKIW